jgi:hypothetical protein
MKSPEMRDFGGPRGTGAAAFAPDMPLLAMSCKHSSGRASIF